MKIEEAKEKIKGMLNDPYGSGSINAIKRLFNALLDTSMGYDKTKKDKSGPLGVLDLENMAALDAILSDRDARIELCHMVYYGDDE